MGWLCSSAPTLAACQRTRAPFFHRWSFFQWCVPTRPELLSLLNRSFLKLLCSLQRSPYLCSFPGLGSGSREAGGAEQAVNVFALKRCRGLAAKGKAESGGNTCRSAGFFQIARILQETLVLGFEEGGFGACCSLMHCVLPLGRRGSPAAVLLPSSQK